MARKQDLGVIQVARNRYWREADARVVIQSWRRSGEAVSAFARRYGLKPRRIVRWATWLEEATTPTKFHPVRVVDAVERERVASPAEAIEIVLSNGRRVRLPTGFEPDDLRRILTVLEGDARC